MAIAVLSCAGPPQPNPTLRRVRAPAVEPGPTVAVRRVRAAGAVDCAIADSQQLFCWGSDDSEAVAVRGFERTTSLAPNRNCAVLATGEVRCFLPAGLLQGPLRSDWYDHALRAHAQATAGGCIIETPNRLRGPSLRCGVSPELAHQAIDVDQGEDQLCVLDGDGAVFCARWRRPHGLRRRPSIGSFHHVAGLRPGRRIAVSARRGHVLCVVGRDDVAECIATDGTSREKAEFVGVQSIDLYGGRACIVGTDGDLTCFTIGQEIVEHPRQVANLHDATEVSVGPESVCVRQTENRATCIDHGFGLRREIDLSTGAIVNVPLAPSLPHDGGA
ncbi:MAG: hypothetical protein AAF645_12440 [Myxococcota bacterium]